MRTSFDNHGVAIAWARQDRPEGHSNHLSFHGPALFSYSTQVGKILPEAALLTCRYYSKTTSRHLRAASTALSQERRKPIFRVPSVTGDEHPRNLENLVAEYITEKGRQTRGRNPPCYERLRGLGARAAEYARLFNLPTPAIDIEADIAKIAAARAARANSPAMRRRVRRAALAKAVEEQHKLAKEAERAKEVPAKNLVAIYNEILAQQGHLSLVSVNMQMQQYFVPWKAGTGESTFGLYFPSEIGPISVRCLRRNPKNPEIIDTSGGYHVKRETFKKALAFARGKAEQLAPGQSHFYAHGAEGNVAMAGYWIDRVYKHFIIVGCHSLVLDEMASVCEDDHPQQFEFPITTSTQVTP